MRVSVGCLVVVWISIFGACDKPADSTSGAGRATPTGSADQPPAAQSPAPSSGAPAESPPTGDASRSPTSQPNPNLRRAETLKGAWWELDENTYDFGTAWSGQRRSHTFLLKNNGPEPLEIYEMKPSCFCVTTERLAARVLPNRGTSVRFHVNLANRVGPFLESMTLVTNDPQQPYIVMEMRGDVRMPAVQEVIYDSSLPGGGDATTLGPVRGMLGTFGKLKRGDVPLKRILRIRNTSGQPLHLSMLPIFPEKSQFSASLKATIEGEEYELTIDGQPPFDEGRTEALISLQTNLRDFERFSIPVSVEVVGRIEVRPNLIVVNPNRASVLERRITIRHDGSQPFVITGLFASDANFDLRLLPQDPTKPNEWRALLKLPGPQWVPPPWGEIIRFETTDAQRPTIDIPVVVDRDIALSPRPDSAPLAWQPGMMPPAP